MAKKAERDFAPILSTASAWAEKCLTNDGSILSDQSLWTSANFELLDKYFVQQPDEGEGDFYSKLEGQLRGSPTTASKLMAEVLWILFLFPSNLGPGAKRSGIERTWAFWRTLPARSSNAF